MDKYTTVPRDLKITEAWHPIAARTIFRHTIVLVVRDTGLPDIRATTSRMNRFATSRLLIRPLEPGDAAGLFAYRSDPAVVRYQMWRPKDPREVRVFIRAQHGLAPGIPGVWFQFAIVELDSGALIGDSGLHVPLDHPDSIEIGLTLRTEAQGKGFATEALTALVDFCFRTLHVRLIHARIHPENARAIALIERGGFSRLATRRDDDLHFTLRRGHWERKQTS
jgi:RimJ/RimL family protein N-acetyltransferase